MMERWERKNGIRRGRGEQCTIRREQSTDQRSVNKNRKKAVSYGVG